MSDIASRKYYKVAVLVYDGADILDFAGPIEVLSRAFHQQKEDIDPIFDIQTIAQQNSINTASLKIEADFLIADASEVITKYDILLVPGASQATIQKLVDINAPELELIRQYASGESKRPRIILSVCTGASLLGAAGILSGMTVTTHHQALNLLRETCAQIPDEQSSILYRRFVDGGLLKGANVRVISSGGVSAGIDATLYVVCRLLSPEMASLISQAMEYGWIEPKGCDWPAKFHCSLY